jgi:predicted dehydrogenase
MILTKCCHDFDMLHWILGAPVVWLNSFGELTHFRPEQAPPGATARCLDDCPAADSCKFYAPRLYAQSIDDWPWNAVSFTPSVDARVEALRDGPYGRCVYTCDNDVVDHQTVNMQLSTGTTVTLTMNGHGNEECRTMRYDGTKATLYGRFSVRGHAIKVVDHLAGTIETIPVAARDSSAHGGGDFGVVRSFLNAVQGRPDPHLTTAEESLESHILAFAAEEARRTYQVIYLPEFRAALQG